MRSCLRLRAHGLTHPLYSHQLVFDMPVARIDLVPPLAVLEPASPLDWLGAVRWPTAAVWLVHEAPALTRLHVERLGVVVHRQRLEPRRDM